VRRRAVVQPASMTSLIDVLFILVFASLVQTAAARKTATATPSGAPDATPAPVDAGVDAGSPLAAGPPLDAGPLVTDRGALRDQALSSLAASLAIRPVLIARVSKDGMLTSLELPGRTIALGVPLLERVPDRDVVVAYLGDRSPELQICRIASLRLGEDLHPYLIVIAPDAALADLQVALVTGLAHDAARCQRDQGVAAVVVDPAKPVAPAPSVAPAQPLTPGVP